MTPIGYTPRTIQAAAQIAGWLAETGQNERFDDGWVPYARICDAVRTHDHLSRAGITKRLAAAINLGLVERRDTKPTFLDQRISYYRTTTEGRKIILQGQDTGTTAAVAQIPGQEWTHPDTATHQE